MPGLAVVVVVVMIAVLLIARPTHDAVLPPGFRPPLPIVAQPAPATPAGLMASAIEVAPAARVALTGRPALAPVGQTYKRTRHPLIYRSAARDHAQSP